MLMSDLNAKEYENFENKKVTREDGTEYWSIKNGKILLKLQIKQCQLVKIVDMRLQNIFLRLGK